MTDPTLDKQIPGPVVELAAKLRDLLNGEDTTIVRTDYGSFYVGKIELVYGDGYVHEVCGYLKPDEHDGHTFDLWSPKREGLPAQRLDRLLQHLKAWIRHGEAVPSDVTTYERSTVHDDLRAFIKEASNG